MVPPVFTEEQLNYFRICYIATNILTQALRVVFKEQWDIRYKTTFGEWNDIRQNGLDFYNNESPDNQLQNAKNLATMMNGNRAEWDCTMLSYAILYSNCIYSLHPWIRWKVNELRKFRNKVAHMTQGQLSETDFRVHVQNVEIAFKALGLSTVNIQTIRNDKTFSTDELQKAVKKVQKLTQDLQKTEQQCQVLEEQLLKDAESFCILPPKPPHSIASRKCEVLKVKQELKKLKAEANSLSYCYISGNPGSGKSQLARLVAEMCYKDARKDTSALSFVMTLSAESPEALMKSYVSWARKVKCPEYTVMNTFNSKDMTTEDKINNLKDLIANKINLYASWLLVVDNVTSVSDTCVFLPDSGNEQWEKGQLLITTQDSTYIPPDSSFFSHISISKGMGLTDARCFLAMVSGITDNDLEDKVTKALDYQPLAIASAGTYMKHVRKTNPTFGCKDYLRKLEQGKRALTETTLGKTNSSYPNSMTVATRIAVERVMNSDEVMKHAFTFLTLCAPELLRLDILTNYILTIDKEQDREEIGLQIQGSSLLVMEKDQDCVYVRLHQVVYDIAKLLVQACTKTDEEVQAVDAAVEAFYQFIDEAMPKSSDSVVESRHIVPHLKLLAAEIRNIFSTEAKKMSFISTIVDVSVCNNHLNKLGIICKKHSEYFSGVEYLYAALKLIEGSEARGVDIDTVNVAKTYHNLGQLQTECGDHQLAKEHFEHALSIQKKKHGPKHVKVAHIFLNLGVLQYHCGNYQLAKEHYERALSIQKKQLGSEHVDVAKTYINLGVLERDCGNYQLAMDHHERALSIQKEKLDPKHVDVATTYNSLGDLHHDVGNNQLAKEHHERALSIQKEKLGPEHVDVASTYMSLGILHRDMGNNQLAKEHYERVLSILKEKLGPEHFKVAVVYINLGILQHDCGNYLLAKEHYERALSIKQKRFGPEHVNVAIVYLNLGVLHRDMGNSQQAKEHFEHALSIQKKMLDPGHVKVARTYHYLAVLHQELGNHQVAKEHLELALSFQRTKVGHNHAVVKDTDRELRNVQRVLDDYQQLREQQDRAPSIQLQKRELDDVDTACTDRKKHRCDDPPLD